MPVLGTYVPPTGKPGKFLERCGCGCGVIALVLLLLLVLLVAMLAVAIVASFGTGALVTTPPLSFGAGMIGLFILLVVAGILLTLAGLLLAWCLFRWLVRTLFGPVLTPMIASLRELARIIRAIADGVHSFAGGIDQAASTLGAVSISIPSIPPTTDLWTLLLNAFHLDAGSGASTARVLGGDVTTTSLSPFGGVQTDLQNVADMLDHGAAAPPGVEQQLRLAAQAIDAVATALETLFGV